MLSEEANKFYKRTKQFVCKTIPPGVRTIVGLLFVIAGVFGFLPILGFWMIPLGIAVIGMDMILVFRVFKRRQERNGARHDESNN